MEVLMHGKYQLHLLQLASENDDINKIRKRFNRPSTVQHNLQKRKIKALKIENNNMILHWAKRTKWIQPHIKSNHLFSILSRERYYNFFSSM